MSHLLDRMKFLKSKELDRFSGGYGKTTAEVGS